MAGRAEGLREFCQPNNGYRAGASGQIYHDSCPAELAPAFLAAYDNGRELYLRERRVSDADSAIAARRYEIARREDSLVKRGFRVVDETATPEQRTQALLDAKQAGERIGASRRRSPNSRRIAPATSRNWMRTARRWSRGNRYARSAFRPKPLRARV